MDAVGYDDQFNDGLFRSTLNASRLERPRMWPKSVSEMRHHTSYGGQGMPVENMRNNTSYGGQGMSNAYDTAHIVYAARPGYQWIWSDRR